MCKRVYLGIQLALASYSAGQPVQVRSIISASSNSDTDTSAPHHSDPGFSSVTRHESDAMIGLVLSAFWTDVGTATGDAVDRGLQDRAGIRQTAAPVGNVSHISEGRAMSGKKTPIKEPPSKRTSLRDLPRPNTGKDLDGDPPVKRRPAKFLA